MNFGFTEEQELLRKTARDFLSEHAPSSRVREVMEGSDLYDTALWGRLAELGWTGLALPEAQGGAGMSMVELCIVLEELGRSLAPVPFLPCVMAGSLVAELGSQEQRAAWLPELASGRSVASLAIAHEPGGAAPESTSLRGTREAGGWRLDGTQLFVPDAAAADVILVAARTAPDDGRRLGIFAVPVPSPGLRIEPQQAMDRLRPLYRLDFGGVRVEAVRLLGSDPDAGPQLGRVLDRARVMICAEMVGGADRCLEDSVQYSKERVQFGRPIGVHQAIKHKCADMLLQVESARSVTYYAAWAAAVEEDDAALAAAMAKAYVSDAYRRVSAENIQIHGGVGFTWEYDCHLYFKRAKSDEAWLGDGTRQRERVATLLQI